MATLQTLIKRCRQRLDDFGGYPDSDGWETDDAECLWSNEELVGYLNEAEEELCRVAAIDDRATAKVVDYTIAAGENTITLHPAILTIEGVLLGSTNKWLTKTTEAKAAEVEWEDDTPKFWITNRNTDYLTVFPTPTADDTLKLHVTRLPVKELSWTQRKFQSPEVNARFHLDLVFYVTYLAWLKEDPDAEDPDRAGGALSSWLARVGQPAGAFSERHGRDLGGAIKRTRSYYF